MRSAGEAPAGTTELVFDVTDAEGDPSRRGEDRRARRARRQRRHRDRCAARVSAARRADAAARRERRRPAARAAGVPAGAAPSRGRIVLMGSIAGRSALPFLGAYAMSKFALEAMADALRVELAPFGMHVAIVEPGTIATPIWTKPQRTVDEFPPEAAELYGERVEKFRRLAAERAAQRRPGASRSRRRSSMRSPRRSRRRATSSGRTRSAARASRGSLTACATAARAVPLRVVGSPPWDQPGYRSSLDELGEGYGFRKIRQPLGVTAFGVNALVFPPGYEGPEPLPRPAGRAVLRPPRHGDLHVRRRRSTRSARGASSMSSRRRHRMISNRTDGDLVLFIVGGKDGYVERDGHARQRRGPRQAPGDQGDAAVNGLMMDYQLTLPTLLRRAESYYGDKEIVTRLPDKSFHRDHLCRERAAVRVRSRSACRTSASSAATASRRSAGTTTSTTRRTSASRAAASSCTR